MATRKILWDTVTLGNQAARFSVFKVPASPRGKKKVAKERSGTLRGEAGLAQALEKQGEQQPVSPSHPEACSYSTEGEMVPG